MAARFELYNTDGTLLLDLADAIAGDVQVIDTGKTNGGYTVATTAGEFVEFAYRMLSVVPTAGSPSRTPRIAVTDNTVSWSFDEPGASENISIRIIAFTY